MPTSLGAQHGKVPVMVAAPIPATTVAVAIADDCPAFRLGLASVLTAAGYVVEEPDDPLAWAREATGRAVLANLDPVYPSPSARDVCRASSDVVVVALLDAPRCEQYQAALRVGAHGAVARDAALEDILSVLQEALAERTLLPAGVARELAHSPPEADTAPAVSADEASLIRALAAGATVSEVADEAGFSERELYRRLRKLYRRLGVKNRSEALVLAARAGVIESSPATSQT